MEEACTVAVSREGASTEVAYPEACTVEVYPEVYTGVDCQEVYMEEAYLEGVYTVGHSRLATILRFKFMTRLRYEPMGH